MDYMGPSRILRTEQSFHDTEVCDTDFNPVPKEVIKSSRPDVLLVTLFSLLSHSQIDDQHQPRSDKHLLSATLDTEVVAIDWSSLCRCLFTRSTALSMQLLMGCGRVEQLDIIGYYFPGT